MSQGVFLCGNSGAYYFLKIDDDAGLINLIEQSITHPKFTWN